MTQRKRWLVVGAVLAVVLIAGGLYWFQPWKLWVDTRVDEALPATSVAAARLTPPATTAAVTIPALPASMSDSGSTVSASAASSPPTASASAATASPNSAAAPAPSTVVPETSVAPEPEPAPVGPVVLRTGSLISHEHETSGSVAIVQQPDGSRVLTLENLSTSDGPDVRVWLSSAPVIPGEEGWYTFADAPHVDLGALKGNLGNQVYEIPTDVDLASLPNVSLWCQRFSVSFGAAELV